MKFSDYMSLKEDTFNDAPSTPKGFGDSEKDSSYSVNKSEEGNTITNHGDWGEDKVKSDLKEACEYILYVAESVGFGVDKISRPEGYGLSTAVAALNQFAAAPDAKSFSKPNINDAFDDDDFDIDDDEFDDIDEAVVEADFTSVVEAADYILNLLEGDGEDCDPQMVQDGIDKNTIVPDNKEDDQFSKTIDVDDDFFNNSSDWDGWDED